MIIRHMAFYVAGEKFALAENVDYTIKAGRTRLIADEGDVGATSGVTGCTLSVGSIEPVQGNGMGLEPLLLGKSDIDVSVFPVGGKIHHIKNVSITQVGYTGEAATGQNKGKWEFEGGAPQITG